VEDQIGRLAQQRLVAFADGGECGLYALLADFLGDPGDAFGQEPGGVAGLIRRAGALVDDPAELAQKGEIGTWIIAPARDCPEVAGRAGGAGLDEDGVAVSVQRQRDEMQHIAAGFALGPKAVF